MRSDWVAVGVRTRGMLQRCVGHDRIHDLAASPSLEAALGALARTGYGDHIREADSLAGAQRAVTGGLLWNLRVLAGWAPREGVTVLRALIGPLEIDNVIDHLRAFAGAERPPPFELGALATAWPRLARTTSPEDLRRTLASSPWGDPGGEEPGDVTAAMHTWLYDRLIATVPAVTAWAGAATLLLVARQRFVQGRQLPPPARSSVARVVGPAVGQAATLTGLVSAAPSSARWVLRDVTEPSDLWAAEARWWARVETDARVLARRPVPGPETLVGAVAVMAADSWWIKVALELAARGGRPLEILDDVA